MHLPGKAKDVKTICALMFHISLNHLKTSHKCYDPKAKGMKTIGAIMFHISLNHCFQTLTFPQFQEVSSLKVCHPLIGIGI